jgi:CBS domain-containing protein
MHESKLIEFEKRLNAVKAADIMSKSVIPSNEEMHLSTLADIMLEKRISGMPVVDKNGKVSGIITTSDLFILMYMLKSGGAVEHGQTGVCDPTVGFAMSKEVFFAKPFTTLDEIMKLMQGHNIHTLPVMESDKLVGIIGRHDVLKHFYLILKELFGA